MNNEALLLALGILSPSFFGSWHCGAMCGPIASLMKTRGLLASYHGGRLMAYIALGLVAGFAGDILLDHNIQFVRYAAASLIALSLAYVGLRLINPERFRRLRWLQTLQKVLHAPLAHKFLLRSGLGMGLTTSLLPCGWLYTYVLAAAATQNCWAGGITMGLFWLGGMPILAAVPSMLKAGITSAGLRQQRIAGSILVVASIYSLAMFFVER